MISVRLKNRFSQQQIKMLSFVEREATFRLGVMFPIDTSTETDLILKGVMSATT